MPEPFVFGCKIGASSVAHIQVCPSFVLKILSSWYKSISFFLVSASDGGVVALSSLQGSGGKWLSFDSKELLT